MPSSYTTSLRLTLPATGELAGQWGNTVNQGITELLDAAVAGTASISTWGGAGVAYTLSNNSGTADEARKMFIVATGTPGEAKNVICPAVSKFYVFRNDTTGGFALTLKTPSGTGISVPAGQYKFLYCDGTNVVEMFNSAGALTLSGALSVGGTTTLASNPTLSAGTANGVTYLNGSKVLTSGSVLTFDGTVLGTTTLDATNVEVTNIKAKDGTASMTLADATGVASFSANPTLSAGTAQGVLYLNGSKVATSGSALTFDGTTLTASASSASTTGNFKSTNTNAQIFNLTASNDINTTLGLGVSGSAAAVFGMIGTGQPFFGTAASDLNIYSSNASGVIKFGLGTSFAEQMRLTSTGLGIGINPSTSLGTSMRLFVNGASGGGIESFYNNLGGFALVPPSTGAGLIFYTFTGGVGAESYSEQMRLTSTGLGIGTSSPGSKLDVNGNVNASNYQILGSVASQAGTFGFLNSNGPAIEVWGSSSANAGAMLFKIAGTEAMRLDSSGNLGLGVTPSAWNTSFYTALQVGAGASLFGSKSNAAAAWIGANTFFNSSNNSTYIATAAATQYRQLNGEHAWYTALSGTAGNTISFGDAKMTLTSAGNLLLGSTTAPTGFSRVSLVGGESSGTGANSGVQFTYNASTYGGGAITTVNAAGGGMSFYTFTGNVGSEAYTERARITSGGDLLVGKTTTGIGTVGAVQYADATYVASIAGSTSATTTLQIYSTGASANRFYVDLAGTVFATNTTISAISDQRFKENIRDLDVGLNAIMALKPRKFDWKAGKGKDIKGDRGFIAQEFEQVFPDLIDEWKDPAPEGEEPYKAVRADLIPVLVKAIQEQQALITDLRARVAALEAQP